MEHRYWTMFKTSWGTCVVAQTEKGLSKLTLPTNDASSFKKTILELEQKGYVQQNTPLLKRAREEVIEYLAGVRSKFDVKIDFEGTPFQTKVWKTLQKIPYGKTWSYQDVAKAIRQPKAMRAVGLANNRNPIPLIVPCHRVIGKDGSLVGYGGGLPMKRKLLQLETSN